MGDIASGSHRLVGGCARCLRSPSVTLAGVRQASSMAVARGSDRVRAALASIPLTDDEGGS